MPPSRPRIEDSRPESSSLTSKTHDKHSILGPTSHSSVQKSTSSRSSRPGQNGTSSTTALSASASASKFAGGGHSNAPVLAGTSEDKEQPKVCYKPSILTPAVPNLAQCFPLIPPNYPVSGPLLSPFTNTSSHLTDRLALPSPSSSPSLPPHLPPRPKPLKHQPYGQLIQSLSPSLTLSPPRLRLPRPWHRPSVSQLRLPQPETESLPFAAAGKTQQKVHQTEWRLCDGQWLFLVGVAGEGDGRNIECSR